jgi:CheY-like chemotaxis protein
LASEPGAEAIECRQTSSDELRDPGFWSRVAADLVVVEFPAGDGLGESTLECIGSPLPFRMIGLFRRDFLPRTSPVDRNAQWLARPARRQAVIDAIANSATPRSRPPRLAAQPSNSSPVRPLKILLAEDVDVNATIASRFIERLGHQVEVATNGLHALELLESGNFDLVLMDIEMPEMDGLEATRRIRESSPPDQPPIPVIAMTAHAVGEIQQKCRAAGMDDYISKPLEPERLQRVLEQYGNN